MAVPVDGVTRPTHGTRGLWVGGGWHDLEDCAKVYATCSSGRKAGKACPRSRTRHSAAHADGSYDVVIVGGGCIGAAVARELSKTTAKVLLIDSADDVSQGATKGNSGIVHAGYDDRPGSVRAQHCWPGNQMFEALDKELHFGYDKNGSLVIAKGAEDEATLENLMERGQKNGVKNLRILTKEEVFAMEPNLHPDTTAALYAPDAGTVVPYEFAIALAENAADNGVEIRVRRVLKGMAKRGDAGFDLTVSHWEPGSYSPALAASRWVPPVVCALVAAGLLAYAFLSDFALPAESAALPLALAAAWEYWCRQAPKTSAGVAPGVNVAGWMAAMVQGGSGSAAGVQGREVATETIRTRYVVNCAGSGADKVAQMVGDASFNITPRLGEYLLQHKSEGKKVARTIFPAPHPVKGKGVLVQGTLWGNLILGPTARDLHDPQTVKDTPSEINRYIIDKCRDLVPSIDPAKTIHAFCGARAKSDRGDWIIEPSAAEPRMILVAGIDSPGLAGSPSIAVRVVELLREQGLKCAADPGFNPTRLPIVRPKDGYTGLKFSKRGEAAPKDPRANVVCKCELVTEAEVVDALQRSLPIDSTQAIRKRTRAGMGHCQGDACNYDCEARVAEIIARETGVPSATVGRRPWPATSTLPQRWMTGDDKQALTDLSPPPQDTSGRDAVEPSPSLRRRGKVTPPNTEYSG
eukprot:TRINITY_DN27682_c0_g1_i1.p1 TRINITY_DN27682_c0_g1~~TRINITY_DN27682_c0_g1_i1.p1  ORF type:complete len:693 (+),score=203.56 TRINITY_DN27682_c0_g1_i1:46-2124(+)